MTDFLTMLGDAGTKPDPMIPGSWVLSLVGLIITTVLSIVFKSQANAAAERAKQAEEKVKTMRLEDPVPTVPVVKIQGPVSWFQHEGLERRVSVLEQEFKTMEERQASQYLSLLNAGHEREVNIKDKIDGVAREWHARLDDQFGPRPKKPGGGR